MKSFLDAFRNLTKGVVALALVAVLSVMALYQAFDQLLDANNAIGQMTGGAAKLTIWIWLSVLVPLILILAGAVVSQLRGKTLAASLILLVGVYVTKGYELFHDLLDFDSATKITVMGVIGFLAFVYLALQSIANLDEANDLSNHLFGKVGASVLIALTFFYFRDGAVPAIITVLPAILALAAGSNVGAIFVLVAGVANIPFNVIEGFDPSAGSAVVIPGQVVKFADYSVLNWLFLAAGLHILVTGVLALVKNLKED